MEKEYSIVLRNNFGVRLKYHIASEDSPIKYPDTILLKDFHYMSLPNITYIVYRGNSQKWEERIIMLPSDTLSIYFFHPDTLSKYSWDMIRKDYNILKRYDLSIEDIQRLDYEITYPPTSNMKDIRQYPPYE
ncbi:MAG: hypothetical protein ACK5H1_10170 [Tenacibaculum sp.]